jgi:purine nucleosidase
LPLFNSAFHKFTGIDFSFMKKIFPFIVLILLSSTAFCQNNDSNFITPRIRVITDNDFSGDPDGLFELAHLALSPSVEIRAVIGSHLRPNDWFDKTNTQAENAANKAKQVLSVVQINKNILVIAGSNIAMINDSTPVNSKAVDFIIQEALRTDTKAPLYILCGAGLTEVASALLKSPSIAGKFILVWIGGPEYDGIALPPPHASGVEYNLNIDIAAARVVFNRSTVSLWQVPRDAYRQAMVSYSQLLKLKSTGKAGYFLYQEIENLFLKIKKAGGNMGETYILGDSPLVLLTALQSPWEPDPSSSNHTIKKAPLITNEGRYEESFNGRNIRVYTKLDTHLLFDDFFTKMESLKK